MHVLTGSKKFPYLDAVMGAWEMFRSHWIHLGGSIAINEGKVYPPSSYYLDYDNRAHNRRRRMHSLRLSPLHEDGAHVGHEAKCAGPQLDGVHGHHAHDHSAMVDEDNGSHPTGELCGSVFWTKLNQRLHRLFPENETFVFEMERSILNVGVANQGPAGVGIRYFAQLHRQKQIPTNHATCCEGQGTRLFGSLPEYLYSYNDDGVVVDMYSASTFAWTNPRDKTSVTLATATTWP